MPEKSQKLKWNTSKDTSIDKIRKKVSGEKDARGRLVTPKMNEEQAAGRASLKAKTSGARTRRSKKS
jgi:hypothetical protein